MGSNQTDTPSPQQLLDTINAIYEVALTPDHYEAFAEQWDAYIAQVDPIADDGVDLHEHFEKALTILDRLHTVFLDEPDAQLLVDSEIGPAALIEASGDIIACNIGWRNGIAQTSSTLWDICSELDDRERLRSVVMSLHDIAEPRTGFIQLTLCEGSTTGVAIRRLFSPHGEAPSRYLVRMTRTLWSDDIGRLIAAEFKLTDAELALLRRMTIGDRFSDVADETNRSVETLKTQARSIYRKMLASSREDAVRIALQFHLVFVGRSPKTSAPNVGAGQGMVTLPDGSRLGWTQKGAADGTAILFLHGMAVGHGFTKRFTDELANHNLKAICIDRPGYGRSDPYRDWRKSVEHWSSMVPALLDALDLKKVTVVTHTTGVLYGCVAAANFPDRINGVCALAGGVPISDLSMLADYPTQVRIMSRTAHMSPTALRFFLGSSTVFYRSEKGRRRIIERAYGHSLSDTKAIATTEIRQLLIEGLDMIAHNGFDGFVGDGLRIFGDWSEFVDRMRVPLHYVIGEEDTVCPLIWAQSFAQKYKHTQVTPIAGAGQLLHHTQPELVAEIIADFVESTTHKQLES
ncbi:alpha/beta fold hydrolase [Hyphococcus sp. DH-69]|uniref:alpha/beta fold hydrolase n=1 Tax=Hyphococcus formosus TaxID=3143534 RepID=UPI00398A9B9C